MTRTPDEIKRELVTCLELVVPRRVQHEAIQHALALIQQLEAELEDMTARYKIADDCAKKKGEMNEKLYAELTAVKAERDAAVECIPRACAYCKWYGLKNGGFFPDCKNPNGCRNISGINTGWEWRGVQKEE